MPSTAPGHPPGLSFFPVLRRVYLFNVVMILLGAALIGRIGATPASGALPLNAAYFLTWVMCVMHCGLFSLLLQVRLAQRAWRGQPDVHAIYMARGSFLAMPRATRWQMATIGTATCVLMSALAHQLFLAILASPWGQTHLPSPPPTYLATLCLALYGMASSVAFEYFWQHTVYQKQCAQEAQKLSAQAQLDLLRSQLDPHLLFNTLSNLYELIDEDPVRARSMLLHLIGFLRSTLTGSRSTEQTLSREFKVVSDYLSLMRIRMGNRLHTKLTLPEDLGDTLVPALLLQPLVENAIKHGLETRREGGMLAVTAWREAAELVLEVSNTGDVTQGPGGLPHDDASSESGFGLRCVQERLQALYGARAGIDMRHSAQDRLTRVTVRLPATPPHATA